jgi:hypothetical protein
LVQVQRFSEVSSDADHDRFWATVRRTLERLRSQSPDGYVARVQIGLADGETIEPAGVGRLDSWIYFEMDENETEVTPARRVIFIHPERIALRSGSCAETVAARSASASTSPRSPSFPMRSEPDRSR